MISKKLYTIFVSIVLLGTLALWVTATSSDPEGPDSIIVGESEKGYESAGRAILAEAGNITPMNITARTQTQAWQGFYGNVTGYLTLDDADNWTMYDWYLAEPQGEIIASRKSSIVWVNLTCLNYTSLWNVSDEESDSDVGMGTHDEDGINETFNDTIAGYFTKGALDKDLSLGTNTIPRNCWATNTYSSDTMAGYDFVEVILQDGKDDGAVYVTIIEDNTNNSEGAKIGFDGGEHDFQIMVPVDGHNGVDFSVNYYFWVELE